MPSKYYKRRSPAATNRKIVRKRPTAANQKYQILSLNKKINRIQRKVSQRTYRVMHKASLAEQNMASPAYVYNLSNLQNWLSIFGSTDNVTEGGKYKSTKMSVDFALRAGTESESVVWTMMIVTPRTQKTAHEADPGTGTLSALVDGVDYELVEGKALMNLKRWKVHYVARGATTPVVTEADGTTHINEVKPARRYITIRNPPISVVNRTGTWKQVTPDEMSPNARYHLILWNNNFTTIEGSPRYSLNVIHQGIVSQ